MRVPCFALLTAYVAPCIALAPSFFPSLTSGRGTHHVSRIVAYSANTDKEEPTATTVNGDDEILSLLDMDASDDDDADFLLGQETDLVNDSEVDEDDDEETRIDKQYMLEAINMARSSGGERSSFGPFPKPVAGAILVAKDGRILGKGRSNYAGHAIEFALKEAGINATPLREWCVAWPSDSKFRKDIAECTLYVTLEPSNERQGEEKPPITQLIQMAGIPRLVIGCQDPIPENAAEGAGRLHAAGVSVTMGIRQEECMDLIKGYAALCNTKLQRMARQHFKRFGRVSSLVWQMLSSQEGSRSNCSMLQFLANGTFTLQCHRHR